MTALGYSTEISELLKLSDVDRSGPWDRDETHAPEEE